MADDMRMLEMNRVGIVDQNVEENELMLELSLGGIFEKSNRNGGESVEKEVPATATATPEEALNVQSKREIQAFRRRELRRKREEKFKKSVGFGSCGSVSGPFVENKEWLDEVLEIEPAHKKERIGNLPENIGSIQSAAAAAFANGFVNHNVMQVSGGGLGQVVGRIDESCVNTKSCVFRPTACRSFRPYEGNMNVKAIEDENIEGGGGRRNGNVNSSGSGGCGSSVFSDSQCSSRHGGATDDSRSNSSNSQLDQLLPTTSIASDPSDHQPTDSSKPTDSTVCEPGPLKPNDQLNPPESSHPNPPSKLDSATQQQASFLARMPSVSTTGNGPNGKTVSGFLYRYTKNEVSIVCVCHGLSFSPAGFVEHAGGVDIIHPLKHITIFPTAFAS